MKKLLCIFLLMTVSAIALDYEATIRYYVLPAYQLPPNTKVWDRPWQLSSTTTGVVFTAWNAQVIGTNQPTMAYLASIEPAATNWWNAYQYSVRQTPEWAVLQSDVDAYPTVKSNLTTSIAAVTDAKTKAALNDAKALIQQLQQEITDLKHVVGKNVMQLEP